MKRIPKVFVGEMFGLMGKYGVSKSDFKKIYYEC